MRHACIVPACHPPIEWGPTTHCTAPVISFRIFSSQTLAGGAGFGLNTMQSQHCQSTFTVPPARQAGSAAPGGAAAQLSSQAAVHRQSPQAPWMPCAGRPGCTVPPAVRRTAHLSALERRGSAPPPRPLPLGTPAAAAAAPGCQSAGHSRGHSEGGWEGVHAVTSRLSCLISCAAALRAASNPPPQQPAMQRQACAATPAPDSRHAPAATAAPR